MEAFTRVPALALCSLSPLPALAFHHPLYCASPALLPICSLILDCYHYSLLDIPTKTLYMYLPLKIPSTEFIFPSPLRYFPPAQGPPLRTSCPRWACYMILHCWPWLVGSSLPRRWAKDGSGWTGKWYILGGEAVIYCPTCVWRCRGIWFAKWGTNGTSREAGMWDSGWLSIAKSITASDVLTIHDPGPLWGLAILSALPFWDIILRFENFIINSPFST